MSLSVFRKTLFIRESILVIITFFLCSTLLFSQSNEDIFYEIELIKKSNNYLFGEGEATNRDDAYERALRDLSSQIEVSIQSSFRSKMIDDGISSSDFIEVVINTYTSSTIQNVQRRILNFSEGMVYSFVFIEKKSLEKEYDDRKKYIFSLYEDALLAKQSTNISRALQLYYYCLILMNSVPEKNIFYQGVNLNVRIPSDVQDILNEISFQYTGDRTDGNKRYIQLKITYLMQPVQFLKFAYTDGGNECFTEARDGKAEGFLTGASRTYNNLEIYIEYRFASSRNSYLFVNDLWDAVKKPSFNNYKKIDIKTQEIGVPKQAEIVTTPETKPKYSIMMSSLTTCDVKPEITNQMNKFLDVFNSKDPNKLLEKFKDDEFLYKKMSELNKYNNPKLMSTDLNVEISETWNGWEVRKIPVSCSYPSISTSSVEYFVLDFDKDGKLVDVNMTIYDELYDAYVKDSLNTELEKKQKQVIVKFLEKYRTAYMNRDIETLEKIFAEEAVIIVGRVLEKSDVKKQYNPERDVKEIEHIVMNKNEYIQRQKQIFNLQRDIHLGFSSFKIMKKDVDIDVYGISMRQEYSSSSYSDEGYLFLLVDFLEKDPLIYVRSWQPGEWSRDSMIEMSDFKILRQKIIHRD